MLCRRSSTRPQQPVLRPLLQLFKFRVAALAAFLLLLSCSTVQVARAQDLSMTITTPSHSNPDFSSWISLLATSLLPPGTPGAFFGAVAAQDVESFCQLVEAGQQTIQASVTAYGDTTLHQLTVRTQYGYACLFKKGNKDATAPQPSCILQLVTIGGCDASDYSPEGVEVVYTDDEGTTSAVSSPTATLELLRSVRLGVYQLRCVALLSGYSLCSSYTTQVICDENAFSIGCAIYVTGDDVNQVNDGVNNGGYANALNGSLASRFPHHRKLMQADPGCRAAGKNTPRPHVHLPSLFRFPLLTSVYLFPSHLLHVLQPSV